MSASMWRHLRQEQSEFGHRCALSFSQVVGGVGKTKVKGQGPKNASGGLPRLSKTGKGLPLKSRWLLVSHATKIISKSAGQTACHR